jgi:DNA-binding MarR family transcriptional regulator
MKNRPSSIQREIKQTRPFSTVSQEAVVALLRTASAVAREFDRLTQQEGVTLQQYNVLRILRGAGEPLPTMEIGDRLLQQTPGISRLLERLEKRGLIRRLQGSEDRRQVLCALTPSGRRIVDRLDGPVNSMDEAVMASLNDRGRTDLVRLLEKVRKGLS